MVTIALKLPVFSGWVLKPGFKARLFEFQASTSCRNANHLVLFRGFELWPPTQAALALRQHPPGPASCLDCAALPASHGVLTSASLHRQEVASQPRVVPRASRGRISPLSRRRRPIGSANKRHAALQGLPRTWRATCTLVLSTRVLFNSGLCRWSLVHRAGSNVERPTRLHGACPHSRQPV